MIFVLYILLFLHTTDFLKFKNIYSTDDSISAYSFHYLPLMLLRVF